ncbi:MAG: creatininase family protein [Gemmatimonadaceae bacterium]|nr:creatininase family protein [Gemmatimonadaceae bacterium]
MADAHASPTHPWRLAESHWPTVRSAGYTIAVLPWGATEAHNTHLPYGTDSYQATWLAEQAARQAWDAGARVLVLPTIPFGVQTTQRDIAHCINMMPSTQRAVLHDVATSVAPHGITSLVILNSHGGNEFRAIIRELQPALEPLTLFALDWWKAGSPRARFTDPGDHAGALETSAMLHIAPALVRPLAEAGDGAERRSVFEAVRDGWAWTPRPWSTISADTGVGDPREATAEAGGAHLEEVAARIAAFLVQLAGTPVPERYR